MDIRLVILMKRNSITRKLTLTNVFIVVLSLLIFFTIVLVIANNNALEDIKSQLIIENRVATTLYINNRIEQPALFRVLTDSINLIYTKAEDGLSLEYSSDDSFGESFDPQPLLIDYIKEKKKVIQISAGSQEYLCTVSTDRQAGSKTDSVIISLLSMKNIRETTSSFTIALVISIAALSLVSVIVTVLISRRITKPVVKLTSIAQQYEKRNFDEKYIAGTNDEIETLSVAVSNMADSLKEHDSDKERLFRQISHEIKTPLTSIYGYAEGIKSGIFEDINKPLDIIMSESLRIKKLTENIVLLSKIESNIEVFSFEPNDVSQILKSAIESIESVAILADIDIEYTPGELPEVSVDEDKLYRAFVNILSNCTKYAKSLIRIETNETTDLIEITISDDGKGFDSEAISNLLGGFAREKSSGSGIGLSIVNEIIKAHGGQFTLGNGSGGGAFFRIALKKKSRTE